MKQAQLWVENDARASSGVDMKRVVFSRAWAMPNADTFLIPPITGLLARWLTGRTSIVDPFARRSKLAHHRNDLNPACGQPYALEAEVFLDQLGAEGVVADALLLDPPYSPRQMSEAYQQVGLNKGMGASQNARLYSACKDRMTKIAAPDCIALTFGWNSNGFGLKRGWRLVEVLMVAHGGAHNDTICTVEVKNG